jgi:hypothetical protein
MPNLTRQVFDATASTYDRDRSRLVPGCDAFYRWAIDPAGRDSKACFREFGFLHPTAQTPNRRVGWSDD